MFVDNEKLTARSPPYRCRRRLLGDLLARAVDAMEIVAGSAGHRVDSGAAIDDVVAGVPDDHVRRRVAGTIDMAGSRQSQVLKIAPEQDS